MSIDLKEFENLFEQYFETIKSFIYYKIGDIAISEDLVQETFIKLWERREEINKETVKSLLYTISSNLSKNHIKHQSVVFNFANRQKLQNFSESPQQVLEEAEFNKKLQNAIGSLSEAHRTTFLMHRIEQITYADIAMRLDISVKTVEKRISIAIKHLHQELGYKL